jgi:anti-sigma28 factor (negative regulator of flagellin synthesis)
MKPPLKANFKLYHSRAERVSAIKKAVQERSYEIDTKKVANILIIYLLNHPIRFYRSSLNG